MRKATACRARIGDESVSVVGGFLLVTMVCGMAALARAQLPPLAPTSDTTIVVSSGPLHFSSIDIPAGVTVRLVAPGFGTASTPGIPAVIVCDGDAFVRGTLSLTRSTLPNDTPAGWVTTGTGISGTLCGTVGLPAGGGRHDYGGVLPFSLEGGSPGGYFRAYDASCGQLLISEPGGSGGGTLALHAGGRIEVHGTITADGWSNGYSGGSGGSILLRGDDGVTVMPGGVVTARGGQGPLAPQPLPPDWSTGQDGLIRLDAWGQPPLVQGVVDPAPTVIELPYLYAAAPPSIGSTWMFDVYAPASGWVYVAASLAPSNGPLTPFGALGIDLAQSAPIAIAAPQPSPSHDPHLLVQWPIPNSPTLVGFAMWLQAIAVPQSLPPRVTNTLAVVVQ